MCWCKEEGDKYVRDSVADHSNVAVSDCLTIQGLHPFEVYSNTAV